MEESGLVYSSRWRMGGTAGGRKRAASWIEAAHEGNILPKTEETEDPRAEEDCMTS